MKTNCTVGNYYKTHLGIKYLQMRKKQQKQ